MQMPKTLITICLKMSRSMFVCYAGVIDDKSMYVCLINGAQ